MERNYQNASHLLCVHTSNENTKMTCIMYNMVNLYAIAESKKQVGNDFKKKKKKEVIFVYPEHGTVLK